MQDHDPCMLSEMQKCRNAEMQKCINVCEVAGRAEMQKCRNVEMQKCRNAYIHNTHHHHIRYG